MQACNGGIHVYYLDKPRCECGEKRRQQEFYSLYHPGWVCPNCGRGNSPMVNSCDCVNNPPKKRKKTPKRK